MCATFPSRRGLAQIAPLLALTLLTLLFASTVPATAKGERSAYFGAKELDLRRYLPLPPSPTSETTLKEIEEIVDIQRTRTPEQAAQSDADTKENVAQFLAALGFTSPPQLTTRSLAFFDRLASTEAAVVDPAKRHFARPRPHMTDPRVQPIVHRSTSGAWPSGHATYGWLVAIVLADMAPDRRAELFARAESYALSRLIGGIHHRSDLIAGRQAASLIAQALSGRTDYRRDFAFTRAEIVKTLSR